MTLPFSLGSIGAYAFSNNQLTSLTIGERVSSIGASAFAGNQLSVVKIPYNVTKIGKNAFSNMKKSGYQFENWYEDENFDTVWDHLTGDVTIYAKWMDVTPPPLFINQVSDKSTTISGTTEKNAKVTLYLNEKKQKEIIADSKGNFTFTINKQKAGVKVKVIAKDDAGNTTEKITTVLDKTAPIISVNQISDQSISVTGTAQVMSTVKLYFGDKWQKITTTNEKGAYTFKISKQKAGVKVKVTATDKAGNTSTKLTTVLDRTAQEQPTVYTVRTTSKIVSGKTEKNATAG